MGRKNNLKKKIIYSAVCFTLFFQQMGFAQVAGELNIAGYLVGMHSSIAIDKFRPLHLRYFSYDLNSDNFKFLFDKGDLKQLEDAKFKELSAELLKYFLIGITLPDTKFWVNLRPDSEDQIIEPELEQTDMGKVLLEADLQLKKDTAKYTSPETPEGRVYWNKLYKKAEELFGYESITIPTLTRPWIVPGEIIVRETADSSFIYKSILKVCLEQDYIKESSSSLAATYSFKDPRQKALNEYSSELIRELIIPKLTKEVNTSKKYAALRQVFYSLILSRWFKARYAGKSSFYASLIDSKNLNGLTSKESWSKTTYFKEYQKSFNNGEYNIKESVYTPTGQVIRSYFSGGINVDGQTLPARNLLGFGGGLNASVYEANPNFIRGDNRTIPLQVVSSPLLTITELTMNWELFIDEIDSNFKNQIEQAFRDKLPGAVEEALTKQWYLPAGKAVDSNIRLCEHGGREVYFRFRFYPKRLTLQLPTIEGSILLDNINGKVIANPRIYLTKAAGSPIMLNTDEVKKMKQKLENLEKDMPEEDKIIWEFGKFLNEQLGPGEIAPERFLLVANLAINDYLGTGYRNPELVSSLINVRIPKIVRTVVRDREDFVKEVESLWERIYRNSQDQVAAGSVDTSAESLRSVSPMSAERLNDNQRTIFPQILKEIRSAVVKFEYSFEGDDVRYGRYVTNSFNDFAKKKLIIYEFELLENRVFDIGHLKETSKWLGEMLEYLRNNANYLANRLLGTLGESFKKGTDYLESHHGLRREMKRFRDEGIMPAIMTNEEAKLANYVYLMDSLQKQQNALENLINPKEEAGVAASSAVQVKENKKIERVSLSTLQDLLRYLKNNPTLITDEPIITSFPLAFFQQEDPVDALHKFWLGLKEGKLGREYSPYSENLTRIQKMFNIVFSLKDVPVSDIMSFLSQIKNEGIISVEDILGLMEKNRDIPLDKLKEITLNLKKDYGLRIQEIEEESIVKIKAQKKLYLERLRIKLAEESRNLPETSSPILAVEMDALSSLLSDFKEKGIKDIPIEVIAGRAQRKDTPEASSAVQVTVQGQSPLIPEIGRTGTVPNEFGGIDFRVMNIITQPLVASSSLNLKLPQLANLAEINLDEEFQQLQNMLAAGITPSGERIKEYLAACQLKGEWDNRIADIISCLVEICRLEEDNVSETPLEIKEALIIADSGNVGS